VPTECSLCEVFLESLAEPARTRLSKSRDLEARLRSLLETAQARWPELCLPPELFLRHLATRLDEEEQPEEALTALHAADSYLACACVQGHPAAVRLFETACFRQVDPALGRLGLGGPALEEVKQALRAKLLVGEASDPPRISEYAGRGDLVSWLRVVAVRAAIDLRRSRRKEVALKDDPELAFFKAHYRHEFCEAFALALAALSSAERNLLREHYLDQLTIDDLAVVHRIHRTTAGRRVAKIRAKLLRETRARLLDRLRIGRSGFDSIMRLIESQLDVSICRLLPPEEG
jgi:RNA polymerase sigma-70 factor (ECF subfamily)